MAQQKTYRRLTRCVAYLLALIVVLGLGTLGSSTAEASILLPEIGLQGNNSLNAERLIAELEEQEAASSNSTGASSSSTPVSGEPASADENAPLQEDNLVQQLAAMTSQTDGSTTGTSSSSGSGSTGSGASLLSNTATVLPDNSPSGRYAAELALAIPDAPGNELLRPPQG